VHHFASALYVSKIFTVNIVQVISTPDRDGNVKEFVIILDDGADSFSCRFPCTRVLSARYAERTDVKLMDVTNSAGHIP